MASHFLSTLPDAAAALRRMRLRAPLPPSDVPDPSERVPTAEEALGRLLGFGGAVRVAELLGAPARGRGKAVPEAAAIQRFVGSRTAAIHTEVVATLARPTEGDAAAPTPEALAEALAEAGCFDSRERRRFEKAAAALGPRFAAPFGAAVRRARKRLGWTRADAVELMQRSGGVDAALLALDDTLTVALDTGLARAVDRAEAGLAGYFGRALLAAAPKGPRAPKLSADDVANWARLGGWLDLFHRDAAELALAVVDREIDALNVFTACAVRPMEAK